MGNIEKEALHYDEVKQVMFALLCELDRVCQLYDIHYCLAYGTLIGAVREHDMIRWDDDADVFITTDNLQKLIAHKDAFRDGFRLVLPEDYGSNIYFDSVVRLNYTYSNTCEDSEESRYYSGLRSNLSLDLFHISPVPSGFRGWAYGVYMCVLYAMANAFRYRNATEHYTLGMKLANFILLPIGRRIGLPRLRRFIQQGQTKYDNKPCDKIHNNGDDVGAMFRFYAREDFDSIKRVHVSHGMFPIPVGYDRILKQQYEDYMTPPAIDRRGWKFADVDYLQVCPPAEITPVKNNQ